MYSSYSQGKLLDSRPLAFSHLFLERFKSSLLLICFDIPVNPTWQIFSHQETANWQWKPTNKWFQGSLRRIQNNKNIKRKKKSRYQAAKSYQTANSAPGCLATVKGIYKMKLTFMWEAAEIGTLHLISAKLKEPAGLRIWRLLVQL